MSNISNFQISIIMGFVAVIATLIIFKKEGEKWLPVSLDYGGFIHFFFESKYSLHFIFILVMIGLSTQLLVFVVLDTLSGLNKLGVSEFIKNDVSNGLFSLRIVTLLISLKAFVNTLSIIYQNITINDDFLPQCKFHYNELSCLEAKIDKMGLTLINLSQFGIYLSSMLVLWQTLDGNKVSLYVSIISWLLLFIVDDWVVIFQTMEALKGRILIQHFIKIQVVNVALFFGVGYLVYDQTSFLNVISIVFLFISLVTNYQLILKKKLL